ncbi:MAG TPA: hypothetical protein VNO70_15020 [Blastocatellia bacterium]|nr:hypothetical protein [Blastocatellia bacterium]
MNFRRSTKQQSFAPQYLKLLILAILMLEPVVPVYAFARQEPAAPKQTQGSPGSDRSEGTQSPAQHSGTVDLNVAFDAAELVRECDANGVAMHGSLPEYTYTLTKVKRTLNEKGEIKKEITQVFEAYPSRNQHILIQVSENGHPLPGWKVATLRKRAGQELVIAEREEQQYNGAEANGRTKRHLAAGVKWQSPSKYTAITLELSAFLRNCEFHSPRSERLGDREAIVLSFRPRLGSHLPRNLAYIGKVAGNVWIDPADKVVIKLEGWPVAEVAADGMARPSQEPVFLYQQERMPAGVWLPSMIRMNARGDESLYDGLNWDVVFTFSEYRRFSTGVEDVKIHKPVGKP